VDPNSENVPEVESGAKVDSSHRREILLSQQEQEESERRGEGRRREEELDNGPRSQEGDRRQQASSREDEEQHRERAESIGGGGEGEVQTEFKTEESNVTSAEMSTVGHPTYVTHQPDYPLIYQVITNTET
jgi:hypothetical protein